MSITLVTSDDFPAPRKFDGEEGNIRQRLQQKTRREQAFQALEILLECLRQVQQHRGAVMGFLGNHRSLEKNIQETRDKVEMCFSVLADMHAVIDKKRLVRLCEEWKTASQVDANDTPLQQFEIHCHLAKNLIDFSWQMIEQHDAVMVENESIHPLNELLLQDFLGLIEKIGQCRALATLIAACDGKKPYINPFESKLEYLLRDLTTSLDILYLAFSHLDKPLSDPLFKLLSQYNCRYKIIKLDALMHKSILYKKQTSISAESVFSLFTMAMDELYEVFRRAWLLSAQQNFALIR